MNTEKVAHPAEGTLVGAIAQSQLLAYGVATARWPAAKRLPVGFEAVDVAILDWIASASRSRHAGASTIAATFTVH
jgi:hypothetical protein